MLGKLELGVEFKDGYRMVFLQEETSYLFVLPLVSSLTRGSSKGLIAYAGRSRTWYKKLLSCPFLLAYAHEAMERKSLPSLATTPFFSPSCFSIAWSDSPCSLRMKIFLMVPISKSSFP